MALTLLPINLYSCDGSQTSPATPFLSPLDHSEPDDLLALVTTMEYEGMPEEMRLICHKLRESLTLIAIESYLQEAGKRDCEASSSVVFQQRQRIAVLLPNLYSILDVTRIA